MIEWFKSKYYKSVNSIAFYPLIMAICFMGISSISVAFSGGSLDQLLSELLPIFRQSDADAARTLISVLAAGLFSLTIFSFSMVMVVISQAANNYSPKILDGFLKDKRPQTILGFYIGTLLFCLPILIYISEEKEGFIPVTGILVALLLTITDLFLFIRFIDYVSRSVKPNEITKRIFSRAFERWNYEKKKEEENNEEYLLIYEKVQSDHLLESLISEKSGNFQGIDKLKLFKVCEEHELVVEIIPRVGNYVLEGTPLCRISSQNEIDKNVKDSIYKTFFFSDIEDIEKNLLYGYSQLTEVAAKALSPGINDIGTAGICIDFITDLFCLFGQKDLIYAIGNQQGKPRILLNPVDVRDLFELYFDEIRLCGRNDKTIVYNLLKSCGQLLKKEYKLAQMKPEVRKFAKKIRKDLKSKKYLDDTKYLLEVYKDFIANA